MEKDYDLFLVLGSLATAFLTSFLAISFARFIIWNNHYKSKLWIFGAAINMGIGIWSMHFIGMLALHIGTPVSFETYQTILSAIFAIVGSYVSFKLLVSPHKQQTQHKIITSFVLGTSVIAMHYIGMNAMEMFPPIQYNINLVIASVLIAYSASYVGLELFRLSANQSDYSIFSWNNVIVSIIIGSAIAAMHYTGMAAANFDPSSYCTVKEGIKTGPLAAYIIGIVIFILIFSFIFIIYEQGQITKKAYRDLENLNNNLETMVEQRTQEIQLALEDLKQTQNKLIESEKMASLGGLVAGVAHEVNTPLGVSLTSSSLLKEQVSHLNTLFEKQALTQKALTEFLSTSIKSCDILEINLHQAANLITNFKRLAVDQSSEGEVYTFNIHDTLQSSLVSFKHELKTKKIQTFLHCDESLKVKTNAGALSQIATNLIMNANIHAFDENSLSPEIHLDVTMIKDNLIEIIFRDNGKGMSNEVVKKAFEPFFTTKRGAGGSGLGLHLVYNLATCVLNGEIKVESQPSHGTLFTLRFPSQLD